MVDRVARMSAARGVSRPWLRAELGRLVHVRRSWPLLILVGLFAVAFLVRLVEIGSAPLDFHAMRQYRGLVIARDLYFDATPAIPAWQRAVADASRAHQGILEPPILENIVAAGYRLLGGEQLWLPRLLSSLAWLAGAAFLYGIARRIADGPAATVAAGFYLLLPFAVAASRSFQPDPLMVALTLAGIRLQLHHHDRPSWGRLVAAGIVSALAVLVLPRTVFVLAAVFLALAVLRRGFWRAPWHVESVAFGSLLVAPSAVYYAYGALSGVFRSDVAGATVLPQLWFSSFFWLGWLAQIEATVGLLPFLGGVLGYFLVPSAVGRAVLAGMWAGYVGFCLTFNYAISVHDYYHLQLVPLVALSVAPMVVLVFRRVASMPPRSLSRLAVVGVLAVSVGLALVYGRGRGANPDWHSVVAAKERVGAVVGHSARTIFLSSDYGLSLEYHGLLAGSPWPLASDIEWEGLAGEPSPAAGDRFAEDFAPARPEFFVVEDLDELALQPDLVGFLGGFRLLEEGDGYAVYDLRTSAGS